MINVLLPATAYGQYDHQILSCLHGVILGKLLVILKMSALSMTKVINNMSKFLKTCQHWSSLRMDIYFKIVIWYSNHGKWFFQNFWPRNKSFKISWQLASFSSDYGLGPQLLAVIGCFVVKLFRPDETRTGWSPDKAFFPFLKNQQAEKFSI